MKKENRTISAFRRLLLAALCCMLPAAAAAQTETPATPTYIYDTSTVKKPKQTAVMTPVNDAVQPKAKRHFMPTRRRIDREGAKR